jgi:hypothetical protein
MLGIVTKWHNKRRVQANSPFVYCYLLLFIHQVRHEQSDRNDVYLHSHM